MRSPLKMGDAKLVDTMMLDGLIDAFNNYHMGITGKNISSHHYLCLEKVTNVLSTKSFALI